MNQQARAKRIVDDLQAELNQNRLGLIFALASVPPADLALLERVLCISRGRPPEQAAPTRRRRFECEDCGERLKVDEDPNDLPIYPRYCANCLRSRMPQGQELSALDLVIIRSKPDALERLRASAPLVSQYELEWLLSHYPSGLIDVGQVETMLEQTKAARIERRVEQVAGGKDGEGKKERRAKREKRKESRR